MRSDPFLCRGGVQQRTGSEFLTALNSGPETWPEISYTEVATVFDETIVPYTSTFLEDGPLVTNATVQQLCPTETVEHLGMAYDNAAWLIGWDALTHPGPAVLDRIDQSTCGQPFMPGVDPAAFPGNAADALTTVLTAKTTPVDREPPLRCYARPSCTNSE